MLEMKPSKSTIYTAHLYIHENQKTMEIDVFSKYTLKSNQTSQSGLAKQATPVFLTLVWGGGERVVTPPVGFPVIYKKR